MTTLVLAKGVYKKIAWQTWQSWQSQR